MKTDFDIVVIGGGHAGIEAALAGVRLGLSVALVTLDIRTVGQMSCNPAIGGVGKGQIVREIDALGGIMGIAADACGMQFRMLNRSKGPAVWGPRCQCDRYAYAQFVQDALADVDGIEIIQAEASEIITNSARVTGVEIIPASQSQGKSVTLNTRAIVITAGTFLNGVMHIGEKIFAGGRYDEPASSLLSDSLGRCGIALDRMKTGTPPRIAAESIDYDQTTRQDGDDKPAAFSFLNPTIDIEQVPCWITYTNEHIHQLITDNLHRAPLYTGQINSTGPRYCPSIETKIVRFPDKDSHQIFLEPEGWNTNWVYCNGISTSLPPDVQKTIVRNIPGLANAKILRYGYAIEYDFAQPTQLTPSLETKSTPGLFLAGQINGTTGYEEAAGQGLVAGTNAAMSILSQPPLILRRDQAYIGVMIDDLVTSGVTEPYRMFTSRAECRLSLRSDNADRRLTPIAQKIGLADENRSDIFTDKLANLTIAKEILTSTRPAKLHGKNLTSLARRPESTIQQIIDIAPSKAARQLTAIASSLPLAIESLLIDIRYDGYMHRQNTALKQMRSLDDKLIPDNIDYHSITHLRHEARENLTAINPRTLGQALRISGITPADINILTIHIAL